MNLALLVKAGRALREGRIGDAAAYKAVALSGPPDAKVLEAVRRLPQPVPEVLGLMSTPSPPGSVGDAFARFVARHRITPISVSPTVRAELQDANPVAVRYLALHDLFHVLLGFGIDRPGELAVWSFTAAQGYGPTFVRAAAAARLLYPLMQPSAFATLDRQRTRAIEMAKAAPCLIALPLEQHWSEPLADVRRALRLPAAAAD